MLSAFLTDKGHMKKANFPNSLIRHRKKDDDRNTECHSRTQRKNVRSKRCTQQWAVMHSWEGGQTEGVSKWQRKMMTRDVSDYKVCIEANCKDVHLFCSNMQNTANKNTLRKVVSTAWIYNVQNIARFTNIYIILHIYNLLDLFISFTEKSCPMAVL